MGVPGHEAGGSMVEERRDGVQAGRGERVDARIAIFEGPYQKTLVLNYSVNVGRGGLFVETAQIRPVDTLLTIKFKLSNRDAIIACQARVAWVREPGKKKEKLPSGMGLCFVGLSLADLHALRRFLERSSITPVW
ncbi:hypothetical protein E4633_18920 [Geomonas terrae]|uniref:PilZ domain-containing protein n=1 Tax=Geomonas terrae TaxID=2562681 RepID=A0A4S1CAF2_9BACT|nr:PilZ domain-containing protein [Geomonas terrae]TGU70271.1 hypothetical protein E4633_18920 [Geomonas terrae]